MKMKSLFYMCAFVGSFSLLGAGCSSSPKTEENSVKPFFGDGRYTHIDINNLSDENFVRVPSAYQKKLTKKEITFADALEAEKNSVFEDLHYPIDLQTDKTYPSAPFYDKITVLNGLNGEMYYGLDKWNHEAGVELNPSIEYWLIQDALKLYRREDERLAMWRPELIGGLYKGYERHSSRLNEKGMIGDIEYMIKSGLSVREAESVALLCYASQFINFKMASNINDDEREYWKKEGQYRTKRNGAQCDSAKEAAIVDGVSLYAGIPKLDSRKIKNKIFHTAHIENPKFTVELWHHLMSKSMYENHPRVKLEGPFSGLLFPEKPNLALAYQVQRGNDKFAVYNDPQANNSSNELFAHHLAYNWFNSKDLIYAFKDTRNLMAQNKQRINILKSMGGEFHASNNRCTKVQSREIVSMGVRGNYFNMYLKCYMRLTNNRKPTAIAYMTSFGPSKLVGNADDAGRVFGLLKYNNGVTASEKFLEKNCHEAIYVAACESRENVHLDFIWERIKGSINPHTVFAYTREKANGKIEGVVYIWGNQIIYDLTDIATWYKTRMAHAVEIARPDFTPHEVIQRASFFQ